MHFVHAYAIALAGSGVDSRKQGRDFDARRAIGQIRWRKVQSCGNQLRDLGPGHPIQGEQLGGPEEPHRLHLCFSAA